MDNFKFVTGSIELLDFVQPLWEKLNKHHQVNSNYFKSRFTDLKFQVRKNKFINDNNLEVKVDLIKDIEKDLYIGYCISTVNKELVGEIDSLFVEKEYRKYGLGDKLMNRALDWLNSRQVKTKIIAVAEGNENVLEFYKRYGFYKRRVILEQINE
ncbi:Protease synthase and sporulation negative regulatory protein PAI 1 [Clostridium liquoris]|jgi:ribosomal protein S18 acetylase RimI-like enzyme|uniref:Protease synthase and sporulation negative regulatory protein PAI 1 n=1 Tax=Clostridium liquoris TaxID=1289519 RepID=A0A2T0B2J3_9CLOT|nr:GNAT family N-acetyltransferase [Clostridium liquoris]PRR78114.1 Protease synthase and sporulation negative regulatory protein PAI 1 [Clostridium liquoris]